MVSSLAREAVRKNGRAARRAIVGADRIFREAALISHLVSMHVLQAPSVGVFLAHDGEPDLMPFVEMLWARGQIVALPVLEDDPSDHTMHFRVWKQGDALVAGRYGIPIPTHAPSRAADSRIAPDCLLVSLTAFDPLGNRMGRGAGFFDRYLATADCEIVGIGFETQRVEHVPIKDHDVSMPMLVTDLGVRYVRNQSESRRNSSAIGKDGVSCE
jgi:5-formyltetrahydrofolate cyclo-ligase